uniref:Uncharacterized protein n=1 Tax=Arundo donax TaxID=35708 RepID=A0A0A9CFG4_ARUDO
MSMYSHPLKKFQSLSGHKIWGVDVLSCSASSSPDQPQHEGFFASGPASSGFDLQLINSE